MKERCSQRTFRKGIGYVCFEIYACNVHHHRQLPGADMCLGLRDHKAHIRITLKLMVDVDQVVFKVDVLDGQTAELRDAHPSVEQNVHDLIVFAVAVIVMDEFQKLIHLIPGDGFTGHAVVYHHAGELKGEGILVEQIIVHRHLKTDTSMRRKKPGAHSLLPKTVRCITIQVILDMLVLMISYITQAEKTAR